MMASETSPIVECPLCGYFSPSLTFHVSHLRLVHFEDSSFSIVCNIEGCKHVFKAFTAYNSHIYRHHRVALGLDKHIEESNVQSSTALQPSTTANDLDIFDLVSDEAPTSSYADANVTLTDCRTTQQFDHTIKAAKLLLHLREGRNISQAALIDVMENCHILCAQQVNNLKHEVRQKLIQANIDISSINGLEDVLNEQPSHPFEGIDTIYLFEKYCADHLGYVVSEKLLHELHVFSHQNLLLVYCNCISHIYYSLSYCRSLKKFH